MNEKWIVFVSRSFLFVMGEMISFADTEIAMKVCVIPYINMKENIVHARILAVSGSREVTESTGATSGNERNNNRPGFILHIKELLTTLPVCRGW